MSRFWRMPQQGSDENSWAQYNDAHIKEAIGECNVIVYDDSDILKISKGRIGIDDDTRIGVSILDTVTIIDYSGINTSHWAELYMTVSAANATFTILQMIDTNGMVVPTDFKNAWDSAKGGYYINSARRCIALVYVDSAGKIGGIINMYNNMEGYNGYCYTNSGKTGYVNWQVTKDTFKKWGIAEIPSWNMDTTPSIAIPGSFTFIGIKCIHMSAIIFDDSGDPWPISYVSTGGSLGGSLSMGSGGNMAAYRVGGGIFDNAGFNDPGVVPRGRIYCEFIE